MGATDDLADKLTKQLNFLKLQTGIASQQKELATLSATSFDTPKGVTTIDGETPVEGLLLAYKAMGALAAKICARIVAVAPSRVLIHNPADLKAVDALRAFRVQCDLIKAGINDAAVDAKSALQAPAPKNIIAAAPVIGAVIASGLQLASLFHVDRSIKYGKVVIEDQVLAITVAGALKEAKLDVYDTAIMPVSSDGNKTSNLIQEFLQLGRLRSELTGLGDQLAAALGASAGTQGLARLTSANVKVVAAAAAFDVFEAAIGKFDDVSGTMRLVQLLDAERLEALLDDRVVILWLKAVAASGSSQTHKNVAKTTLSFSGGAIVSYAIYRRHGELVEADTWPLYSGWVKLEDLPSGGLTL